MWFTHHLFRSQDATSTLLGFYLLSLLIGLNITWRGLFFLDIWVVDKGMGGNFVVTELKTDMM